MTDGMSLDMIGPIQGLPLSEKFTFALSGGVDSSVALTFLIKSKRYPKAVVYINHKTENSLPAARASLDLLRKIYSIEFIGKIDELYKVIENEDEVNINLHVQLPAVNFLFITIPEYNKEKHATLSKEEYWREQRLKIFEGISSNYSLPVVLCHHLDDCIEQHIISTLIRRKKYTIIPYRHEEANVIRPFRRWRKEMILEYARRNNVIYYEDKSNLDVSFVRNKVRHEIVPKIKELNPGIYKHIDDLIEKEDYLYNTCIETSSVKL